MDWYVMRHPETGGVGVVPGSALDDQRARGWVRVSEALDRDGRDFAVLASYVDAPDLDAKSAPTKKEK